MNEEPDYKNYDITELESTYSYIDKEAYPERAKKLREEIESRLNTNKVLTEQNSFEHVEEDEYQAPEGNWFKLHWQGQGAILLAVFEAKQINRTLTLMP